MNKKYSDIIEKLLKMNPDPIPLFVLQKEYLKIDQNNKDYKELYKQVCNYKFVKKIEENQNERGFWKHFHGFTEGVIRKCISYGLDKNHVCLKNVSKYLVGTSIKLRTFGSG